MARKTYRQRYMTVYKNLQKELQKPIYSGIGEISIPKRIGRKQLERLQDISKQIKTLGKRVERLQSKGFIFEAPPIQLPSRLTKQTVKYTKERTRDIDLARKARYERHLKGLPQYGLEPFTIEKTGIEGLVYERELSKQKAKSTRESNRIVREAYERAQEEYEAEHYYDSYNEYEEGFLDNIGHYPSNKEYIDYRNLYDILEREPTREEYEAYIEEAIDTDKYELNPETGEYETKTDKRREFYEDNEYEYDYGEDEEPSQIELSYGSINELLQLLDSFDPDLVGSRSPITKANRFEMVQSLKNDIEILLETGDKARIAQNIEDNWEEISEMVTDIMYRSYASGMGQGNTQYDPIPDYNKVWGILNA